MIMLLCACTALHARDEAAKGGVAHHHGGQGARRLAAWRQKKDGRLLLLPIIGRVMMTARSSNNPRSKTATSLARRLLLLATAFTSITLLGGNLHLEHAWFGGTATSQSSSLLSGVDGLALQKEQDSPTIMVLDFKFDSSRNEIVDQHLCPTDDEESCDDITYRTPLPSKKNVILFSFADQNVHDKYAGNFAAFQCYADKQGYSFERAFLNLHWDEHAKQLKLDTTDDQTIASTALTIKQHDGTEEPLLVARAV